MDTIPANYKKLLFNKEAHEPLTSSEQEAWEQLQIREPQLNKEANIDDPEFITAMKVHYALEVKRNAAWEKIKKAVKPEETGTDAKEIDAQEQKTTFRIPGWVRVAAAAAIVVVSGILLYFGKYKSRAPTTYLILGSGFNEICNVTLPDGSRMQLNALSYVRYPERFAREERHVELTGEASFTVESDKEHPFRVSALETDLIAMGTSFNVKAYKEEGTVTATLQHGKLQAKSRSGSVEINEGDQAVIKDGNIRINKNVNMDFVLAWQQKFIILENESLLSILYQINRYYNIKFTIEGKLPAMPNLAGMISATDNSLPDVLHTIESHVPIIKFEFVNDNMIVVKENKFNSSSAPTKQASFPHSNFILSKAEVRPPQQAALQ